MLDIEHLIENALCVMTTAKEKGEDERAAFDEAMSSYTNADMLKNVCCTKEELWAIAQYIVYTYCALCNCRYKE